MKRTLCIILILVSFFCGVLAGVLGSYLYQDKTEEQPVIAIATPEPIDMEPLRAQIEGALAGINGDWSVYIKHLDTNSVLDYQNQQLQPASVIKMFRMVAFYRAVKEGLITTNPEILDAVKRMIIYSENAASNEVVTYIGKGDFGVGAEYVTQTAIQLGCKDTQDGMMLFDYDPGYLVPGINYSSVSDCGLVLEKIYRKECVSPQFDEEMLQLLLGQTRREKIPALLPQGTKIANKTGETNEIQADVGIVFSPKGDYVICAMVNNTWDNYACHQAIGKASEITYQYFNKE